MPTRAWRMDEILVERYEEFLRLCRWALIDRFDRRGANRAELGDVHRRRPARLAGASKTRDATEGGLDGGYAHAYKQPNRREGWFEVIVKSDPHRRDREVLRVPADLRHQTKAAPVRAAQRAGHANHTGGETRGSTALALSARPTRVRTMLEAGPP